MEALISGALPVRLAACGEFYYMGLCPWYLKRYFLVLHMQSGTAHAETEINGAQASFYLRRTLWVTPCGGCVETSDVPYTVLADAGWFPSGTLSSGRHGLLDERGRGVADDNPDVCANRTCVPAVGGSGRPVHPDPATPGSAATNSRFILRNN